MNGHSGSRGVKSASVNLYGQKLTVHAVMPISNGTMGPGTTFLINGIERMDVGLLGGVENGTSDNFKVRVEVQIEVTVPSRPKPPRASRWQCTSRRSSSSTSRSPAGTPRSPRTASTASPGQSASRAANPRAGPRRGPADDGGDRGVPVGVSGIVFLRVPVSRGPGHGRLAGAALLTDRLVRHLAGSALTMVNCTGLTVKVDVGGGVGLQASTPVQDFLKKSLGNDAKDDSNSRSSRR